MRALLWVVPLGLYATLASYSYGKVQPVKMPPRLVYAWANDNARKLADVYGLTPESLDTAMNELPYFKKPKGK